MSTTDEPELTAQVRDWVTRLMTAWDLADLDTVNAILEQPGAEDVGRLAVKGFFMNGDPGNGAGLNDFLDAKGKEPDDADPRD